MTRGWQWLSLPQSNTLDIQNQMTINSEQIIHIITPGVDLVFSKEVKREWLIPIVQKTASQSYFKWSTFAPNHYNLGHTYVSTILKLFPRRQKVTLPLNSANTLYFTYLFILFLFAELKQTVHPIDPHPLYPPLDTNPTLRNNFWCRQRILEDGLFDEKKYTENWKRQRFLFCRAGMRLRCLKSGMCFAISGKARNASPIVNTTSEVAEDN